MNLQPYFDALRRRSYRDSAGALRRWLHRVERQRGATHATQKPNGVFRMLNYARRHPAAMTAAGFTTLLVVACNTPVEVEETVGYELYATIADGQYTETEVVIDNLPWVTLWSSRQSRHTDGGEMSIVLPDADVRLAHTFERELAAIHGVMETRLEPLATVRKRRALEAIFERMSATLSTFVHQPPTDGSATDAHKEVELRDLALRFDLSIHGLCANDLPHIADAEQRENLRQFCAKLEAGR